MASLKAEVGRFVLTGSPSVNSAIAIMQSTNEPSEVKAITDAMTTLANSSDRELVAIEAAMTSQGAPSPDPFGHIRAEALKVLIAGIKGERDAAKKDADLGKDRAERQATRRIIIGGLLLNAFLGVANLLKGK